MRVKVKVIIVILISIFIAFLGVMYGSSNLTLANLGNSEVVNTIILNVRLPRIAVAAVVGSALSVSGTSIQTMLKNPLASPYTLGISSGAGLGASIAIVLQATYFGAYTTEIFAFISALLTIYFVIKLANLVDPNLSTETIVLTGMIFSLFLGAIISLLMLVNIENTRAIILFMSGTLVLKSWNDLLIILPFFLFGAIFLFIRSKSLDILSFGEDDAHSIGVNTRRLKTEIMVISSLLTAIAVATCGVIGFVGLVVPHITRRIFGAKHYLSIPMSIFIGGSFLILADLLARTIASPMELPVGAITALVGAPFFAVVFITRRF